MAILAFLYLLPRIIDNRHMDENKIILTGIKPTGRPHIGNYLGAIEPALRRSLNNPNSFFFIPDYHALNNGLPAEEIKRLTHAVAATWIASGLDSSKQHFYRQSDIPEIFELETILNATVPKGWMNKAHAYKAAIDQNIEAKRDVDYDVNMGLYTYPILMASDILIFNANQVPVGKDQIQHVEIARDIAGRFNSKYHTSTFTLPEHLVEKTVFEVPGVDGRKMSKSYNNFIPLFASEEEWNNAVKKIVTDSNQEHTHESFKETAFYKIFSAIANENDTNKISQQIVDKSIGWKEAKDEMLSQLVSRFKEKSDIYFDLLNDTNKIDEILKTGAEKIRPIAMETLNNVKATVGVL